MLLAHQGSAFDEIAPFFGVVLVFVAVAHARDRNVAGVRKWGLVAGLLIAAAGAAGFSIYEFTRPRGEGSPQMASPAMISILSADVRPATTLMLDLRVQLEGGILSEPEAGDVQGDVGHLHVLIDGALREDGSDLTDRIDIENLTPGEHLLEVEFVASDHGSYAPPVRAVSTFRIGGA